ncbi:hypothetical protein D5R93_02205 [Actinomyces lilanjuaniae]|uniref:Mycothiol-dependent maleylpyruvate isomerase metal-binding domain-containing protein n=1 Tax=Actinomyces lilanjuaniae TaxID=2321394 RepID=A0ABM6Z209_9ACTO|nr:hypothetical protein [Actinomyces lilanjuaniae]AYD89160.1 hypothetical protein D5R93_02205 [Actinomyces lilanjuaniae]
MTLTTAAPADLAPVRRRLDAATPGPWDHDTVTHLVSAGTWPVAMVGTGPEQMIPDWEDEHAATWTSPSAHDDAELISHAPEDIHALLGEVDRLRDALTQISHLLEETWTADLPRRITTVLGEAL